MVMPHDCQGLTKSIEGSQTTRVAIHRPQEMRRLPRYSDEVLELAWCLSRAAEGSQEPTLRPEHAYLVGATIRNMDSTLTVLCHPDQDTEDTRV